MELKILTWLFPWLILWIGLIAWAVSLHLSLTNGSDALGDIDGDCIWIMHRYFPRDPNARYTYVLKNTSGQQTTVFLPPCMPEPEQRKALDAAYRRLGVEPEGEAEIKTP